MKKPFPAEHPYTSHISQFAVFPKFDSASDPKRGTDARRIFPKNADMPSTAYDVTIIQKTKGNSELHKRMYVIYVFNPVMLLLTNVHIHILLSKYSH